MYEKRSRSCSLNVSYLWWWVNCVLVYERMILLRHFLRCHVPSQHHEVSFIDLWFAFDLLWVLAHHYQEKLFFLPRLLFSPFIEKLYINSEVNRYFCHWSRWVITEIDCVPFKVRIVLPTFSTAHFELLVKSVKYSLTHPTGNRGKITSDSGKLVAPCVLWVHSTSIFSSP